MHTQRRCATGPVPARVARSADLLKVSVRVIVVARGVLLRVGIVVAVAAMSVVVAFAVRRSLPGDPDAVTKDELCPAIRARRHHAKENRRPHRQPQPLETATNPS